MLKARAPVPWPVCDCSETNKLLSYSVSER